MSVVSRQQFALNDISSKTAKPRALIFGRQHCLEDFYQVCLKSGPWVENGPAAGDLELKNEIYLKIVFSRTDWLKCLKFGV